MQYMKVNQVVSQ